MQAGTASKGAVCKTQESRCKLIPRVLHVHPEGGLTANAKTRINEGGKEGRLPRH